MIRLTSRQAEHLRVLAMADKPRGAYPGLHMGILRGLVRRGFVRGNYSGLGAMAMPHTAVKWSITKAGRLALEEGKIR